MRDTVPNLIATIDEVAQRGQKISDLLKPLVKNSSNAGPPWGRRVSKKDMPILLVI